MLDCSMRTNKMKLATIVMLIASAAFAKPIALDRQTPIPGQSTLYTTYHGKAPPYPGNETSPIPPTSKGPPGPDDVLFQNLLAGEWIILELYQQAVEAFNTTSFTSIGYPNTTYDRIAEIRDNEAGHIKIFQDSISTTSIKPGPCKYDFGFDSPETWLALQVVIEVSSMTFLTGLTQQAQLNESRSALLAVGTTESRHNAWALIDIWNTSPFAGPADTVFPFGEQILSLTNAFVVNGSCPNQNPEYPTPDQHLPTLDFNRTTSKGHPGQEITFTFPAEQPDFKVKTRYFAVYCHGLNNITVPFVPENPKSTVPDVFADQGGIILVVIADETGAPTEDSVIAGPLILLQQPSSLTTSV